MKKKITRGASDAKHHSVYVIALDSAVLEKKRFREANPNHKAKKPCLYVGMTGKTPEERFEQHKAGIKACSFVKDYGKHLRRRLYERYNPMTYKDAVRTEVELAEDLRRRGYAVWQK